MSLKLCGPLILAQAHYVASINGAEAKEFYKQLADDVRHGLYST
jgi:hypothetical protein